MKSFDELVQDLSDRLQGKLFFVEIGAMDGVGHDALHEHIVRNSEWSGVLVEPLEDMFLKLQKNYKGRKNLFFENSAITEKTGEASITRIPVEMVNNECPDWADGISTLRPEIHIIGRYENLRKHSVVVPVVTITFDDLVKKYDVQHIDILQIDTEGYDKVIFEQVWNKGFRPALIKLEALYMQYMEILELEYTLGSDGYQCILTGEDLVAYKD